MSQERFWIIHVVGHLPPLQRDLRFYKGVELVDIVEALAAAGG
jgi:hypothetical protein